MLKLYTLTVIVTSVFEEYDKYYPQYYRTKAQVKKNKSRNYKIILFPCPPLPHPVLNQPPLPTYPIPPDLFNPILLDFFTLCQIFCPGLQTFLFYFFISTSFNTTSLILLVQCILLQSC